MSVIAARLPTLIRRGSPVRSSSSSNFTTSVGSAQMTVIAFSVRFSGMNVYRSIHSTGRDRKRSGSTRKEETSMYGRPSRSARATACASSSSFEGSRTCAATTGSRPDRVPDSATAVFPNLWSAHIVFFTL